MSIMFSRISIAVIALSFLGFCVLVAWSAAPPPGTLAPVGAGGAKAHAQAASPSDVFFPGIWVPEGPAPIQLAPIGPVPAPEYSEATGAIKAAAAHPANADILYVATVNGGIWKTTNATAVSPTWTPQTDDQKSLSMGALKFDPTDANRNTLIAGIGRYSAFIGQGGPRTGLLRTINGGSTWTPIDGGGRLTGSNISGVAARGSILLATANTADNLVCDNVGLFRSTDAGKSFILVSGTAGTGLPGGRIFDLAEDPANTAVLYAPVLNGNPCSGGASGVYKSTDTGATWRLVSDAPINAAFIDTDTNFNCKIAVGANNTIYVGVVNSGVLAKLSQSRDGGATWTPLDVPDVNMGGQGRLDLSIAADPGNANLVYVDGDLDGVRLDSTMAPGRQVTPFWFNNTKNRTSPHPDSRGMAFDAKGNLLDVDDGGIYRRTAPQTNTGDWFSVNGNLQVGEIVVAAFDHNSNVVFAGVQDNGALLQLSPENLIWKPIIAGDAGDVALDVTSSAPNSIRYLSTQNFAATFRRNTYSPRNELLGSVRPALTVIDGGTAFTGQSPLTPLKINAYAPRRILIGGQNALYESFDQAATITELKPTIKANNNAIAYGAIVNNNGKGVQNPDVIFVGTRTSLYKRDAAPPAELVRVNTYPGSAVINGVAVSTRLPFVWVSDASNVFFSNDSGTTWFNVTGNLPTLGAGAIRTLVSAGSTAPMVGTDRGVFVGDPDLNWHQVGTGLPNAPVFDLYTVGFAPSFGTLIAGTLGRGAWRFASFATPTQTATATATRRATPIATPKPTPRPTFTPKPGPTPKPAAGALVRSTSVADVGAPGSTVAAGAFTITNELPAAESISSVTISASRPGLFSSMAMNGGGQSVTVMAPGANTTFTFTKPVMVPGGGSVSFSLNATIAANPVMLGRDIKFAGLTVIPTGAEGGSSRWPLGGALLMLGMALLSLPHATRRRALIIAVLALGLAAAATGCGGGNNGPRFETSAQQVTGASVTAGEIPETVEGVPASLGTVSD